MGLDHARGQLHRDLNVPIGLIQSSWGGTRAEAWISKEALTGAMPDDFTDALKTLAATPVPEAETNDRNRVTVLYNAMIAPLLPFAMKGVIWYQGEYNATRARHYRTLLPTLITDWRSRFGAGDLPFLIVQLANYRAIKPQPGRSLWAELREAQFLTAREVPRTGLAVTIDIGDADDIHPRNKQEVGRRLALAAEAIAYGKTLEYSGPLYRDMKVEGHSIRLTFTHLGGGLVCKGEKLEGFAIAGADRKFVWANAVIEGDSIVVTAPDVTAPVAVRYAWADNPVCNLSNAAGLPASPFRTDDWNPRLP